MPSITIRNVPQATRDELASRAARSGRSLQEYLLGMLAQATAKPDIETSLAKLRRRKQAAPSLVPADEILGQLDADRR